MLPKKALALSTLALPLSLPSPSNILHQLATSSLTWCSHCNLQIMRKGLLKTIYNLWFLHSPTHEKARTHTVYVFPIKPFECFPWKCYSWTTVGHILSETWLGGGAVIGFALRLWLILMVIDVRKISWRDRPKKSEQTSEQKLEQQSEDLTCGLQTHPLHFNTCRVVVCIVQFCFA